MKDTHYYINGLKAKNEKVILEIYTQIFPNVKRFVLNNKGAQEDAEDVFQKALIQIMARVQAQHLEIKSSFDGYLFTACKNLWRRDLNKSKLKVTNSEVVELKSEARDLALSVLEQERWEFFQEKLNLISDNCKEILKQFFNKVPYKVIAEKLSYTSENVVRQRVFKCKNKLTEMIQTDNRFNQLKEL